MASRIAALLLLSVICFGLVAAQIIPDCCKDKTSKFFPLQRIESYTVQGAGEGCQISATRIFTKGGRSLCVSHPDEQEWVKKHITYLEKHRRRHH